MDSTVASDAGQDTTDATPVDTADTAKDADTAEDADAPEDADVDAAVPTAPEIWVTRVGDGSTALGNASVPVFIDRFTATGTLVGSIPLPTTASGGDQPFVLGTATHQGTLTRSTDGRFVTLAGFATTLGVEDPHRTNTSASPRVVARITAAGMVSTSTTTTAYDAQHVYAAVTDDGTRFWLAGTGSGITFLDRYGSAAVATLVSSGTTNVRGVAIIGGALFGTRAPSPRIFDFGGALPTTLTTPVELPGTSSAAAPRQIIGFATGSSGVDLIYACDDFDLSMAGGLQRWTKASGTWTLSVVHPAGGPTYGCTKLTGSFAAGKTTLYAITLESPSRLVTLVDDLSSTARVTPTTIATAGTNTAFRGVAFAPHP